MPAAFDPPPTHATAASGNLPPLASWNCARASFPITAWNVRTIVGYGCGPNADPITKCVLSRSVTHVRNAWFTASRSVPPSPGCAPGTAMTRAPSSLIRKTFSAWRWTSSAPMKMVHFMPKRAARVAVATPCWPAPVSAMMAVLPSRLASTIWPSALLILWLPVWVRSSRLSQMRAPPAWAVRRGAK